MHNNIEVILFYSSKNYGILIDLFEQPTDQQPAGLQTD